MAKKRNPPDSTHRNARAGLKRDRDLVKRINRMQAQIDDIDGRLLALALTVQPDRKKR